MRLHQKGYLVVEIVDMTPDYQPIKRFDKLSVQIKSGF